MGHHKVVKVGERCRFECQKCDITMDFPTKSGMLRYSKLHKKFCSINKTTIITSDEISIDCKTNLVNILTKEI